MALKRLQNFIDGERRDPSGHGKDPSMYGFEEYTRVKHVMSNIEL